MENKEDTSDSMEWNFVHLRDYLRFGNAFLIVEDEDPNQIRIILLPKDTYQRSDSEHYESQVIVTLKDTVHVTGNSFEEAIEFAAGEVLNQEWPEFRINKIR